MRCEPARPAFGFLAGARKEKTERIEEGGEEGKYNNDIKTIYLGVAGTIGIYMYVLKLRKINRFTGTCRNSYDLPVRVKVQK